MKYKYFMFDWDGSLGNTLPLWFEAFQKIFKEYGIEVNFKQIGEDVIGDWEGPRRLGIVDSDEFFAKIEDILLPKLQSVSLNPGVKELVEKIKASGGKVAVVTTSRKKWVKGALRNNGLRELVDVFLGKEDVENYKPDPEILEKALKLMGGNSSEAIMIGDTVKDIQAARFAGVDSALYYPKEYEKFYDQDRQKSLKATYIVGDFSDLEKYI